MTSVVTVKKEVEKLKEKTGAKEPKDIYVTLWHGLMIDETGLDIVKREGEWITIRVECKT